MTVSSEQIRDAAFLSSAAYEDDEATLLQLLASQGWELLHFHRQLTGVRNTPLVGAQRLKKH